LSRVERRRRSVAHPDANARVVARDVSEGGLAAGSPAPRARARMPQSRAAAKNVLAAVHLRVAMTALVHLASGVGNIVLATPLLVALDEMGLTVDVWLDADYPETADLLRPWSVVRHVHTTRLLHSHALAKYDV